MAAALINLLPDVRQAKLAAKRHRRLATAASAIVISTSILIVLAMLLVTYGQKLRISQLSNQISRSQNEINQVPNLNKMITLQQNLAALPPLFQQRVYLTRLYSILGTVSPKDLSLQSLNFDGQGTLKLEARARNYGIATKLVDALEASNVSVGSDASLSKQPHFTNVILGSVVAEADGKVSFNISAQTSSEVTHGQK